MQHVRRSHSRRRISVSAKSPSTIYVSWSCSTLSLVKLFVQRLFPGSNRVLTQLRIHYYSFIYRLQVRIGSWHNNPECVATVSLCATNCLGCTMIPFPRSNRSPNFGKIATDNLRVVGLLNSLPRQVVGAETVSGFESGLDTTTPDALLVSLARRTVRRLNVFTTHVFVLLIVVVTCSVLEFVASL